MSDAKDEKKDLTEEEAKALAHGLREAAVLREQIETFHEAYRALDRKYPLKGKSKSKYKEQS